MLLLASVDDELARWIGERVEGPIVVAISCEEAIEKAQAGQPTVVVIDVRLGGNSRRAVECIPAITAVAPCAQVIVWTVAPTAAEVEELARFGAYGYVDRKRADGRQRLIDAIGVGEKRAWKAIAAARRRHQKKPSKMIH